MVSVSCHWSVSVATGQRKCAFRWEHIEMGIERALGGGFQSDACNSLKTKLKSSRCRLTTDTDNFPTPPSLPQRTMLRASRLRAPVCQTRSRTRRPPDGATSEDHPPISPLVSARSGPKRSRAVHRPCQKPNVVVRAISVPLAAAQQSTR